MTLDIYGHLWEQDEEHQGRPSTSFKQRHANLPRSLAKPHWLVLIKGTEFTLEGNPGMDKRTHRSGRLPWGLPLPTSGTTTRR